MVKKQINWHKETSGLICRISLLGKHLSEHDEFSPFYRTIYESASEILERVHLLENQAIADQIQNFAPESNNLYFSTNETIK
jgi:hypothetical protein